MENKESNAAETAKTADTAARRRTRNRRRARTAQQADASPTQAGTQPKRDNRPSRSGRQARPTTESADGQSFKKKIVGYLTQLSVVIIGIMVTFCGNDLIDRIKADRTTRQSMSMIHSELLRNLTTIEQMQRYNAELAAGVDSFIEYADRMDDIPADSLFRYSAIFTKGSLFGFETNAMETLKNSNTLQNLSNRNVVFSLFHCYDMLDNVYAKAQNMYDERRRIFMDTYYQLPPQSTADIGQQQEMRQFIGDMMSHRRVHNYVMNMPSLLTALDSSAASAVELLNKTLVMLEREFDLAAATQQAEE